jgi:hypothetical protein
VCADSTIHGRGGLGILLHCWKCVQHGSTDLFWACRRVTLLNSGLRTSSYYFVDQR